MYPIKTILLMATFALVTATLLEEAQKPVRKTSESSSTTNATPKEGGGRCLSCIFGGGGKRKRQPPPPPRRPSADVCTKMDLIQIVEQMNVFQSRINVIVENTNKIESLQNFIEITVTKSGSSLGLEIEKYFRIIQDIIESQLKIIKERLEIIEAKVNSGTCSPGTFDTSRLEARIDSLAEKIYLLLSQLGNGGSNVDIRNILQIVTQIQTSIATGACQDSRMSEIIIILNEMRNSHTTVTREIESIKTEIRTVTEQVSSSSSSELLLKLDNFMRSFQGSGIDESFSGTRDVSRHIGGNVNTQVKTSKIENNQSSSFLSQEQSLHEGSKVTIHKTVEGSGSRSL